MTKKQKFDALPEHFQNMILCWPFSTVLHKDIAEFSHGALSRSRLANIMCDGEGPPTFRIMKKNASDLVDMTFWLFERTEKMNRREN